MICSLKTLSCRACFVLDICPFRGILSGMFPYLRGHLTLNPKPQTLGPAPTHSQSIIWVVLLALHNHVINTIQQLLSRGRTKPRPYTLNPKPLTLTPKPWTLNPKPWRLNSYSFWASPVIPEAWPDRQACRRIVLLF